MKKLTLTRFYNDKFSTCGILSCPELKEPLFTLELPNKNNERNISCIPKGKYKIKPYHSRKHGKCFAVYNVTGRDKIRVHIGNSVRTNYQDPYMSKIWDCESRGCILPGMKIRLDGIIEHSKIAMDKLREIILDEWDFEIV